MILGQLLRRSAARWPDHVAVEDEHGRSRTFAELDRDADKLAGRLAGLGIGRGDRVGLFLPKSIASVAAIHGILRSGAAYVPVDPTGPADRAAGILGDAGVKAVVVAPALADSLRGAGWADGPTVIPDETALFDDLDDTQAEAVANDADDLAYVLYTSGSTGRPKGVMLSHRNASCFLDWCEATFPLRDDDRFTSHAPFHFDLSIFDLFASCRAGATLVLVGEALGKEPTRLGAFLAKARPTVWYSAPSILALLTEYGGLDAPEVPAPRLVLFAGEVFPIRPLKRLRALWPDAAMWNLYGPTETNVCTAEPIPATIPDDRHDPFPIGRVCPPLRARVVDDEGTDVAPGDEGELVIAGPGVMQGYLNQPEMTIRSFLIDPAGERWYRTGDRVVDDGDGVYRYVGRRDRMVKRRGCRIELGEIEAGLSRHKDVARVAAIARSDDDGVSIVAFLAMRTGVKGSTIALKRHCTEVLPGYMIPDRLVFVDAFPETSTGKTDYAALLGKA